ncbi:MAG: response regulator transcription factor [Lacunisphaera sp.]|jgi:DNA-binding CsgD family transcriptional regulator|nr:response regulator transcription factor [Lacunisphaera sp.]
MGLFTESHGALPRRDSTVAGVVKLTPAEAAVAALAAQGLSNPEIARRLRKAPSTVSHQLSAVYRKLGIHRRARLITMFRP